MDIKLDVDVNQLVQARIQSAIADVLGKDSQMLIDSVVKAALSKPSDPYSRQSIFEKTVHEMIVETAKTAFKEWVDQQKPVIHAAILKRMKIDKANFVEKVADQLVDAMSSSFYVSVGIRSTSD